MKGVLSSGNQTVSGGLDRSFRARFWTIARPYWAQAGNQRAWAMLSLLIALLLGQTTFNVLFVEQTGEFTSALAARDAPRFWASIRVCVAILVVAVPIWALYYWMRDSLGNHWRLWLTHRFLDRYLAHRAYYELNLYGGVDNPDQRIAEDIKTFTQQSLYFLMVALGALLQLAAFTGVLWSISHELVFFLIAYAIGGNLITTMVFGRALIRLNFLQLRREADFRFSLIRIREHAESIAFHRGEAQEAREARRWFEAVFENFARLIRAQFTLNLFQYAFSFLTLVLPSAILASRVIDGELEVGRAVQAGGAFAAILAAMTVIVDHFESLSRFAAGTHRLDSFARMLDRPDASAETPDPGNRADLPGAGGPPVLPRIETREAPLLSIEALTLMTPNRERTLIRELSLEVAPGEGLLIVGRSGGGKSSLLRAIAGLWHTGEGQVLHPPANAMMFLPQHPYMVLGSLRAQLLYPYVDQPIEDARLLEALVQVNLPELAAGAVTGLDAQADWAKRLSIGEQQRLAFARVLLRRPVYVMLDEATSALDAANEQTLYRALADSGSTAVSVSHRPSLLAFHRQVLELPGGGAWRLVAARDYRFD